MLNREICRKCKATKALAKRFRTLDQVLWVCRDYMLDDKQDVRTAADNPPADCPFLFEHLSSKAGQDVK